MPHETHGILYDYVIGQHYSQELHCTTKRLVVFLPGQVCHTWRIRKGKCCNNCEIPWSNVFALRGTTENYNFEKIPIAFPAHKSMLDNAFSDSGKIDTIAIFNGGSFLTDHEIPEAFRRYTIEQFADHPTAQQLLVEARPEHMKQADLATYVQIVGDKKLKIALGFESSNDWVRNKLHEKFMGKKLFERNVKMAKSLGIQIQVYVFLKPAGLTEKQAIEDVLETCAYLHELNVDEMALSCAFIPEGGHLDQLYKRGEFRPPWLWSILEIQQKAAENGWPLSIGGFDDFPPPIATAHNCTSCSSAVEAALDDFRKFGTLPSSSFECDCKTEWQNDCSAPV